MTICPVHAQCVLKTQRPQVTDPAHLLRLCKQRSLTRTGTHFAPFEGHKADASAWDIGRPYHTRGAVQHMTDSEREDTHYGTDEMGTF